MQGLYKSLSSCKSHRNGGFGSGTYLDARRHLSFVHLKGINRVYIQPVVGPDGKKKEPESNVLLASIENMQYAVTVDVLHTVTQMFLLTFFPFLAKSN